MNQLSLTLEEPRARRRDPYTSHRAAERAKAFAPTHSQRIVNAMLYHGCLTAQELSEHTGLTVVQICRRLPEIDRLKPLDIERDGFRVWSIAA